MTIEQLRKTHQARPFRPFVLRTADDREYLVKHPEFLFFSPGGRTIYVFEDPEAADIIDLLLVASIHFTSNGRVRRPRSR